jgi:hypothetical protein
MTISASLSVPSPASPAGNAVAAQPGETATRGAELATAIANYPNEKAPPRPEPRAAGSHNSDEEKWARNAVRHLRRHGVHEIAIAHYLNAGAGLSRADATAKFQAALADAVRLPASAPAGSGYMNRLRNLLQETGILDAVAKAAFADTRALIKHGAALFKIRYEDLVDNARATRPGLSFDEAEKVIVDSLSIDSFMHNIPRFGIARPALSGKPADGTGGAGAAMTRPASDRLAA